MRDDLLDVLFNSFVGVVEWAQDDDGVEALRGLEGLGSPSKGFQPGFRGPIQGARSILAGGSRCYPSVFGAI